ncbi:imelysin family protein [Devosia neptuniae]|jgi:putative iron-regulated protein|uniref:imelysin family protein n=1 Tax=Devosia TaxID=46913 RepID=UPI0022AF428D|nr:imelysin family protein [Devosia neptuniae]MCZ4347230.1 peptidase [Devosia neptuniae]|tara:strand:- start:11263 stop:12528 length:1266 start_codon:yes stop_codon:yes gene_type:complete
MISTGVRTLRSLAIALTLSVAPVAAYAAAPAEADVLANYADLALAGYEDSLSTAKALDAAIDALIADPSAANLDVAKDAWKAARIPYQQTEAFRFGNPIVDEWEGRVNAWPLDEGLIDYVDASYGTESDSNALYVANVIANPKISIDGEELDATDITPALLQEHLQEAAGVESNVATGYHAIEFLLWGQDLNGTDAGAGAREYTDYSTAEHADRRAAYLKAASSLLVSDLEEMVANWTADGAARAALPDLGISAILTGMGSLSFGEVAGERMKLGLLLHDPEEEHDCFSDNTHASHLNDAVGIQNVYLGKYTRVDGSVVEGPALASVIAEHDAELDAEIQALLADTVAKMQVMADRAEAGEAYDQQIGEGNAEGNAVVQAAIDGLIAQTRGIERAVALLELGDAVTIEDSDSLSNPDAVFE